MIVGLLRANGIDASLSSDDLGGMRPEVGFVQGTRVLVLASDVQDAQAVLREVEPTPDR